MRHTSSRVFLRSSAATSAPPRSRSFSSNRPERSTRCSSWRFSTSVSTSRPTIRPNSTMMPKKPARVPRPSSSAHDRMTMAPAAATAGTQAQAGSRWRSLRFGRRARAAGRSRPSAPGRACRTAPRPARPARAGSAEADLPRGLAASVQAQHQHAAQEQRVGAARIGAHRRPRGHGHGVAGGGEGAQQDRCAADRRRRVGQRRRSSARW